MVCIWVCEIRGWYFQGHEGIESMNMGHQSSDRPQNHLDLDGLKVGFANPNTTVETLFEIGQ
jgi:hypothetical protein